MLKHRNWASLLVLLLIVATVLSACGATPEPEVVEKVVTQVVQETVIVEGESQVVEKEVTKVVEVEVPVEVEVTAVPEEGEVKQIVLVEGTAPKSMDPFRGISSPESHLSKLLFQTLVEIDYDKGEVVPELAESWEVGDDQLTWTFKLKEGIKFSDGTDFNAEAAKYSLDLMSDEEFSHVYYNQFGVIKDVEVLDEYTVQFKTETPFAPLLINLAHRSAGMVSPTAREEWGEDFTLHPVGTGPYQLQSWEGDTLVLERNPYYNGPPTWYDEIKQLTVPEGGARAAMLETGEADIVIKVPPQDVERLQANPDLRVDILPSLYTISLEVNTQRPPLDNPLVRQALMHAIDQDAISANILQGLGVNPISPVGPGIPHRKNFDPYPYDPDKAKELLAEAGYPDGFDIKLWSPHGRYLRDAEVAEAVQGYLADVGINADLQTWEWSAYLDAVLNPATADNEKELFLLGRATMGADFWMYRLWHSTSVGNVTGYNNARVDELLDLGRTVFEPTERDKIYGKVQEIIFKEDLPFIFLYNQNQILGTPLNLYGLDAAPAEYLLLKGVYKQ